MIALLCMNICNAMTFICTNNRCKYTFLCMNDQIFKPFLFPSHDLVSSTTVDSSAKSAILSLFLEREYFGVAPLS